MGCYLVSSNLLLEYSVQYNYSMRLYLNNDIGKPLVYKKTLRGAHLNFHQHRNFENLLGACCRSTRAKTQHSVDKRPININFT